MSTTRDKESKPPKMDSKEARGERLKELREISGLTRATIERKYGLSARTLKNWEVAHGTGLTENGARRVIDIYQKESIQCTVSWLMQGKGQIPNRMSVTVTKAPAYVTITDPLDSMQAEIDYFLSLHPEALIYEVKDDAMYPFYKPGDVVGGIRCYANDIPNCIDFDCIIELTKGDIWLRRLQNSTIPDKYNLYAINPSTKVERPTIYSTEVLTAARVMRHWRGKKWLRH